MTSHRTTRIWSSLSFWSRRASNEFLHVRTKNANSATFLLVTFNCVARREPSKEYFYEISTHFYSHLILNELRKQLPVRFNYAIHRTWLTLIPVKHFMSTRFFFLIVCWHLSIHLHKRTISTVHIFHSISKIKSIFFSRPSKDLSLLSTETLNSSAYFFFFF